MQERHPFLIFNWLCMITVKEINSLIWILGETVLFITETGILTMSMTINTILFQLCITGWLIEGYKLFRLKPSGITALKYHEIHTVPWQCEVEFKNSWQWSVELQSNFTLQTSLHLIFKFIFNLEATLEYHSLAIPN